MLEANRLVLDALVPSNEGTLDHSQIEGRVIVQPGAQVMNSKIRGPAIIGERTRLENAYVGPYTSINHDCLIRNCEIEHSIVLENSALCDLPTRVADSLIGRNVQINRASGPTKTLRLTLGDHSQVDL
jgi:glucose-1-phosphate thymidylyltransferase